MGRSRRNTTRDLCRVRARAIVVVVVVVWELLVGEIENPPLPPPPHTTNFPSSIRKLVEPAGGSFNWVKSHFLFRVTHAWL